MNNCVGEPTKNKPLCQKVVVLDARARSLVTDVSVFKCTMLPDLQPVSERLQVRQMLPDLQPVRDRRQSAPCLQICNLSVKDTVVAEPVDGLPPAALVTLQVRCWCALRK